ncbi:hypothetical protein GY45DRAFT_1328901 [Cubamyces sp. BRFM 1775]|nr:hypothetical protein GY45DRAFT_1328901 [Cubamyces sp. BRFM 1775]
MLRMSRYNTEEANERHPGSAQRADSSSSPAGHYQPPLSVMRGTEPYVLRSATSAVAWGILVNCASGITYGYLGLLSFTGANAPAPPISHFKCIASFLGSVPIGGTIGGVWYFRFKTSVRREHTPAGPPPAFGRTAFVMITLQSVWAGVLALVLGTTILCILVGAPGAPGIIRDAIVLGMRGQHVAIVFVSIGAGAGAGALLWYRAGYLYQY